MKSKAITLFKNLGFNLCNSNNDFLLYKYETDYEELLILFDLLQKAYRVDLSRFIDNNEKGSLIPMSKRSQNIKHSAIYGHWQKEGYCEIGIELHNAIHQQIIELGWVE